MERELRANARVVDESSLISDNSVKYTDDKLILTEPLKGAKIQNIKVQNNIITIYYFVPEGRDKIFDKPYSTRIFFDKEKVKVESLVVTYELNEIRAEFELKDEYKAKVLNVDTSNGYDRLVFRLNK